MTEEHLKSIIIDLLYDLHALGQLNANILNSISHRFGIDAFELCEDNGITYNLE